MPTKSLLNDCRFITTAGLLPFLSFIFAHGERYLSLKSAIGLSCLSIMTSVRPASSGEQAIDRVGVAWSSCSSMQGLQGEGRGLRYTVDRRAATGRHEEPEQSVYY